MEKRKMKYMIIGAVLILAVLLGTGCFRRGAGEPYEGWTYSHDEAQSPEALAELLKSSVKEDMSLDEMLTAFEEMCQYPVEDVAPEDEMLLFESGTYSFDEEEVPKFYFSVVRQFPNNEDDEFYQIHLDVIYVSDSGNEKLKTSFWNDETDQNFFEWVRESKEYQTMCNEPYLSVEAFMDET